MRDCREPVEARWQSRERAPRGQSGKCSNSSATLSSVNRLQPHSSTRTPMAVGAHHRALFTELNFISISYPSSRLSTASSHARTLARGINCANHCTDERVFCAHLGALIVESLIVMSQPVWLRQGGASLEGGRQRTTTSAASKSTVSPIARTRAGYCLWIGSVGEDAAAAGVVVTERGHPSGLATRWAAVPPFVATPVGTPTRTQIGPRARTPCTCCWFAVRARAAREWAGPPACSLGLATSSAMAPMVLVAGRSDPSSERSS